MTLQLLGKDFQNTGGYSDEVELCQISGLYVQNCGNGAGVRGRPQQDIFATLRLLKQHPELTTPVLRFLLAPLHNSKLIFKFGDDDLGSGRKLK